jgi:SAM-dependent methyltransferase
MPKKIELNVPAWQFDSAGAIIPNMVFHRTWDHCHSRCIEYPWAISRYDGGSILDVGSAKSNPEWLDLLDKLGSSGVDVTIVDLDPPPPRFRNLHFCEGDLMNLPFEKDSFDCVIAVSVLEHIGLANPQVEASKFDINEEGDYLAFNELIRVLKNGGQFILTVPFGPRYGVVLGGSARAYDTARYEKMIGSATKVEEEYYEYGRGTAISHFGPITWKRLPRERTQSQFVGHTDGVICASLRK